MNSIEALENLTYCVNGMESKEKYYKIIKQDLDRLEKLEKEHNKLKERYKHRAETSNDLCKAVKQYEKAFEILKENHEIALHYGDEFPTPMISINGVYSYINEEEYELLKEVLNGVE